MRIRRGISGIAVVSILCVFFALFARSDLVRYVSVFFLAIFTLMILYVIAVPRFIRIRHQDSTIRGIKLNDLSIRLEVRNISPMPVSFFTLTDRTGGLFSENNSFAVGLRPFEVKTLEFNCRGHRRGRYCLGPVELTGSDPLGFFTWKKTSPTYLPVIVYPSIYKVQLSNQKGLPAGNLNTNNRIYEDLTRFRSLREYSPGDEVRRINWKATAKTNTLYTMEFDPALYFPLLIVLNFSMDDYPLRGRDLLIERAAEKAASLAFYYTGLRQEICFTTSGIISTRHGGEETGIRIERGAGYEHTREILEIIAMQQPGSGSADFNALLFGGDASLSTGTRVMIVSPELTEEQTATLLAARRRGVDVQRLEVESSGRQREAETVVPVIP